MEVHINGHPLGVTGARLAYSAALELQLTGKKYALVTMCWRWTGICCGYRARLIPTQAGIF